MSLFSGHRKTLFGCATDYCVQSHFSAISTGTAATEHIYRKHTVVTNDENLSKAMKVFKAA